ncbi:hypothetical protein V6N12_054345 [Hibiscus sabdariffa]|uniref:DUF4283 domain-containing protein n=1 Tax=Hibiscus sabdariffa TaxID=183260 RepID=A0ABR2D061_9ROSI
MLGMDWICPIFRLCGRLERRFWVLVLKEALRKLLQIGSCSKSLQFFPPVEKDGQVLVQPPRAVLVDGAKQWNNALVVNFLGKSPSLPVFQRTVDKLWGREVDLGDDNVIAVGVELVWAPPKCSHCSIFGHLEEKCARSVVVDDSAQLNASNGIVKLETVVSTNLVDFVKDIVVSMGDAVLSPNKFDALATTAVEQVECLFLLVRLQVELRSY